MSHGRVKRKPPVKPNARFSVECVFAGVVDELKALESFSDQGRQTEICVPDLGDFNDVLGKENAA